MGMIDATLRLLFGNGANVVKDTAEVFRVNAEASAARDVGLQQAVLQQFAAEFARPKVSLFNRVIDGVNRLPRPAMALGTLGLFVSAMVNPIWFAARMQGVALVPEPMWWIMGAIISFYFGARHQVKGQEFQRSIAETMARVPVMAGNLRTLRAFSGDVGDPADGADAPARADGPNPALDDWRAGR